MENVSRNCAEDNKERSRRAANKFYRESRDKYDRNMLRYWTKRVLSLSPQEIADLLNPKKK